MITKLITDEVQSPTTAETATELRDSGAFRAVNTSTKSATVTVIDTQGQSKSITLMGGESIILKKTVSDKVYSSSKFRVEKKYDFEFDYHRSFQEEPRRILQ